MKKKNEAHELVLQCLTEALLQIMERKPFSQISISELCERAGVSRISFYRNFNSMPEILVNYLSTSTDEWWEEFITIHKEDFHEKFWEELLTQYKKNERLIKLLFKNDMSYIIKNHIFNSCGPKENQEPQEQYLYAMLAGAIYGIVEQWIKLGMKEYPSKINMKDFIEFAGNYAVNDNE